MFTNHTTQRSIRSAGVTVMAFLAFLLLATACGAGGFDRDGAIEELEESTSGLGEDGAACVVDGLLSLVGEERMASEGDPTAEEAEQAMFLQLQCAANPDFVPTAEGANLQDAPEPVSWVPNDAAEQSIAPPPPADPWCSAYASLVGIFTGDVDMPDSDTPEGMRDGVERMLHASQVARTEAAIAGYADDFRAIHEMNSYASGFLAAIGWNVDVLMNLDAERQHELDRVMSAGIKAMADLADQVVPGCALVDDMDLRELYYEPLVEDYPESPTPDGYEPNLDPLFCTTAEALAENAYWVLDEPSDPSEVQTALVLAQAAVNVGFEVDAVEIVFDEIITDASDALEVIDSSLAEYAYDTRSFFLNATRQELDNYTLSGLVPLGWVAIDATNFVEDRC